MCSRCSAMTKKVWVFGCSTFVLLAALILGLLWPTLYKETLYSQLELRNGSLAYNNWIVTPIPMYLEFNMFNWTNADQAHVPGVVPNFVEMGPYVFEERHERVAVDWHPENGTVSFNQTRTWHFRADMSTGSLDDVVTNLNVISASVAYAARDMSSLMRIAIDFILNTKGGSLMISKTVRDLLFDGYDDPLLDLLKEADSPAYPLPPFDRFGWFVERNESSSYDGRLTIFTGHTDIKQTGNVYAWNGSNRTAFYRDECSAIRGTTGELLHPEMNVGTALDVFATDVCRSLPLAYDGDMEMLGLAGAKWIGDDRVFDNGLKYPDMACYCTGAEHVCPDLMPGVMNISDCRYGAPAFVSFPHFYLADQSYRSAVQGMAPNRSIHEFSISVEPQTGIPIDVKARLQINILLQPIERLEMYKDVPKIMVPMFWFTQRAQLNEELAAQARIAILAPSIGLYVAYGIGGLGLIILAVGILLTFSKSWNNPHTQFHNESEQDDELQR